MAEEKQFKASRRKLDRARKEGQVLKSRLITQFSAIFGCLLALTCTLHFAWVRIALLVNYCLTEGYRSPYVCLLHAGDLVVRVLAIAVVLGAAFAFLAEALQVGFRYEFSVLIPVCARISPAAGLRRIVQAFKESWLPVLGILALCLGASWILNSQIAAAPQLLAYAALGVENSRAVRLLSGPLLAALGCSVFVLLVTGCFEYLIRRRKFLADLSMSRQELRDEMRESEGDPLVRGVRRSLHESLAMQDLAARIKKAKVIVVERASPPL